jgi:hypothetical protein
MVQMSSIDDDYPTCRETYVTLRIYHEELNPQDVSSKLRLTASHSQSKGQVIQGQRVAPIGGWFIGSEGHVDSRDVQRHIGWILDQLLGREALLLALQDEGYETDLFCFWASATGHGGPELSPEIMERLSSLRLKIGFDIYC